MWIPISFIYLYSYIELTLNSKLSDIITKVEEGIKYLHESKKLDKLNCKRLIENIINPHENLSESNNIFTDKKFKSVYYYFEWYIQYYSENPSPISKSKLKKGTLRTYSNAKSFLKKYLISRKIKIEDFTFNNIDKSFYYDLLEYSKKENYSKNYTGTIIQKLKTIIASAYENGVHDSNEYNKRYFAKMTEEADNIYLNDEELGKIFKVELNSDLFDSIRDIFLISCYTGLRVGDLEMILKNSNNRIRESNGRKYLHYIQQKTNAEVEIPLKKEILEILTKRKGSFPNYVNKAKLNEYIKIIGKRTGIDEPFKKIITKGGKSVTITLPKYKFITMHTGRRSFCTNAYLEGVPLQFIMIASGHKSEKMLLKYIKASASEKAKKLEEFEYFN